VLRKIFEMFKYVQLRRSLRIIVLKCLFLISTQLLM